MYLSRLILNPRSGQVRSEIGNPYEMHRTIMRAFPDESQGGPGRVLFRLDERPQPARGLNLLIQSEKAPDWNWLQDAAGYLLAEAQANAEFKAYQPAFEPGQRLCFRLRANPTVKRDGKRLGLYREEQQRDWLARKAETGGFKLLAFDAIGEGLMRGKIQRAEQETHALRLLAIRFEGLLQVTGPEQFLETLKSGIGSGKGLGFGLLSVTRSINNE